MERKEGGLGSPYEFIFEVVFIWELVLGVRHWKFYAGNRVFVLDLYAMNLD